MKLYKLFIATAILLLFNVYMIAQHDFVYLRIARLISMTVFFVFFVLSRTLKDKILLGTFVCFLIADICLCFYENMYLNQLKFFFSIIGYSLIIKDIYPNIKFKRLRKFSLAILVVVAVCCISLIISALNMASYRLFGVFHEVLFCIYGLVLALLLLSSIAYNQSSNSIFSNLTLGFSTFFILADVCLIVAYYLNRFNVFQMERVFYLTGLTAFAIFAVYYRKSISESKVQALQKTK